MTRVLEICNQLGIGGTERTMQIFSKYLVQNGFEVYVCGLFRSGERECFFKEYASSLLLPEGDIAKVKQYVIENSIDLVHWHSIANSGEEKALSIELLNFFREQNIPVFETSPFSLFSKEIDILLTKKLFVSQTNLLKFFWKFGKYIKDKKKYGYLYNPIDTDELKKYRLNAAEKKILRNKYGLREDDFVIGKVGRSSLWKWDDTIIEVATELRKRIPNLKIVIRAIPDLKKKKIESLGLSDCFLLLPETSNEKKICETYQLMDVMCHTSRIGESFGVSMVEGMFFGLPVITKSTDFMRYCLFDRDNAQIEIVQDVMNGFIESTNQGILSKIEMLFLDTHVRGLISSRNMENMEQRFSAEILTKRLISVFNNLPLLDVEPDLNHYIRLNKKERVYDFLGLNLKALYEAIFLRG